jgi:TMEM175 potassium channel family protein
MGICLPLAVPGGTFSVSQLRKDALLSGMSAADRKGRARKWMLGDEPLTPSRLEAFSDGVIAIILTIMVLELKTPASANLAALMHEWPIFVSYVISFFYVAVYWINHHHLFHRVKHVDLAILWTNIALLFSMSLIPFFTEWVESTRLSPFPTAIYAGVMLLAGAAFSLLDRAIGRQGIAEADLIILRRAAQRKNLIAICIYAVAIPIAFYRSTISMALVFLVALLYAVPWLWVEHWAEVLEGKEARRGAQGELHEPYAGPPVDR